MRFQLETFLVFLLSFLSLGVLSAPVNSDANVSTLQRRVLTPQITFTDDLKDFPRPPTPPPGDKKGDKAMAKYNHKQGARTAEQNKAASVVTAALQQSQGTLGFPDNLAVTISNNFHTSKSDPNSHVTFNFNNPKCGTYCVGHAYDSSKTSGWAGQIWDGKGGGLWGQK